MIEAESQADRYDVIGQVYAEYRKPDTRIAAQIEEALGDARTVLNVGAGTGSYEPKSRSVIAVEPSLVMISQRKSGAAQVVRSVAEKLPFASGSFDAALAVLTVHHWGAPRVGLRELSRVARRVVILHFDPIVHNEMWVFSDYLPECNALRTHQVIDHIEVAAEIRATRVETVPVPGDCTDGFNWAYWKRPERYLDPQARACISGIALLPDGLVAQRMEQLRADIADGSWHRRHGHLLALDAIDGGLRLVVRD
jgi:SAM-dependent methyltransferase